MRVLLNKTVFISMRVTPEIIRTLGPNDIFVFGSNLKGLHGGGAARFAMNFGAEWGNGVGIQGQTYAIPTLSLPGGDPSHMLPVSTIGKYVNQFIEFAKSHPEYTFYVTPIGCGIAGFTPEQIGPLFTDAISVENIYLPADFINVIENGGDSNRKTTLKGLKGMISNSIRRFLK